uniref:Uncharacterized protein n=1 Tax=Populus trichocarpa TaxID=3694 RepID=A0A2K2C4K0_POPTR
MEYIKEQRQYSADVTSIQFSERYGPLYLALLSATVFFSGLYSSCDFHVSEAQIRSEYPTNFTSSLLLGSSNTPFPFFIYLLTAV